MCEPLLSHVAALNPHLRWGPGRAGFSYHISTPRSKGDKYLGFGVRHQGHIKVVLLISMIWRNYLISLSEPLNCKMIFCSIVAKQTDSKYTECFRCFIVFFSPEKSPWTESAQSFSYDNASKRNEVHTSVSNIRPTKGHCN